MDRDALKRELTEHFQQTLEQAMQAVEQAPDGRWIAASEWQVREIFQKLMAESFQRILQAKLDAADPSPAAAFSPSAGGQGQSGKQRLAGPGRADGRR